MRIGSFLFSLLLHLAVLAVVLFWPDSRPPVDLNRPVYQVSLVMGDPGGENLASAVLGPRPPATAAPGTPATLDAPVTADVPRAAPELAAPAADTPPPPQATAAPQPASVPTALPAEQPVSAPRPPLPTPREAPQPVVPPRPVELAEATRPERENEPPKPPEPRPQPSKEPEKQPETPPERPKPVAPKPETPPQKPADQPKPSKAQDKPATQKKPPTAGAAASALADLQKPNRTGGSAATRALADLENQSGRTGVGGGGGVGDGPGGGGLYDVYVGQVMLLVQSNWSLPIYSRDNLVVQVRIVQDASGRIQDCHIVRSSGRNDVDASAINAVIRTKQLPPPPTPDQQELIVTFNTQMAGR